MGVSIHVCPRQEFSLCLTVVRVVETQCIRWQVSLAGSQLLAACQVINALT